MNKRLVKLKGSESKPKRRHARRGKEHGPQKWLDSKPSQSRGLANKRKLD